MTEHAAPEGFRYMVFVWSVFSIFFAYVLLENILHAWTLWPALLVIVTTFAVTAIAARSYWREP